MNYKLISNSTVQILAFSAVCIALVVSIFQNSSERIETNKKIFLQSQFVELVPDYENDILQEKYTKLLTLGEKKQTVSIYPARKDGKIIAHFIKHHTSKGYSGDIHLLTALNPNKSIIGVRILEHKETPGLGDNIEFKKSSWILQFDSISLDTLSQSAWTIKTRGGKFDSLTGATITPLAVIDAIYELLEAVQQEEL